MQDHGFANRCDFWKMCDDVSSDYEKVGAGKTTQTSVGSEKSDAVFGTHEERSKQRKITRSSGSNNFKTFEGITKTRHKKSLEFQKNEGFNGINKNTGNDYIELPLIQPVTESLNDNSKYQNVIKHVKDVDRGDVFENSLTLSFQAEDKTGVSLPSDATNTAGSKRYSNDCGRFKIHRKNERKSSLISVTLLPPVKEEKHSTTENSAKNPSVLPNIRRHTIGYQGESKEILLPSIVVTKAEEDVSWEEQTLKLPKLEASNSKSRYQRRLSLPDPSRLAPPIFQDSPKNIHRPPLLQSKEDGSDYASSVMRLPRLKTGSSMINGIHKSGNQKKKLKDTNVVSRF